MPKKQVSSTAWALEELVTGSRISFIFCHSRHHPHNQNTTHLCCKHHVWQAHCLEVYKNWSWQLQHLTICSPCWQHNTCKVQSIINKSYFPQKWHIFRMYGTVVLHICFKSSSHICTFCRCHEACIPRSTTHSTYFYPCW